MHILPTAVNITTRFHTLAIDNGTGVVLRKENPIPAKNTSSRNIQTESRARLCIISRQVRHQVNESIITGSLKSGCPKPKKAIRPKQDRFLIELKPAF
jgi:hypothetical protein